LQIIGVSREQFEDLKAKIELLYPKQTIGRPAVLNLHEKLVLTLYKLRQNPTFAVIGWNFGITDDMADRAFADVVPFVYETVTIFI
jgi:hypothetical protein